MKKQDYYKESGCANSVKGFLIILIAAIVVFIFGGCSHSYKDYTYTFKVKVTYWDGGIDTTVIDIDSFEGRECYIYLSASNGNILSSGVSSPCIIKGCWIKQEAVICGVRKYEVLKMELIPLINLKKNND